MRRRVTNLFPLLALVALALGCGSKDKVGSGPSGDDPLWTQEARVQFPTLLDLQVGVLSHTCSPNPNVCHQTNSFPDMHTVGNTLSMIGTPCNVELPNPAQGWDSCELPADRLVTDSLASDIAWIEQLGSGSWQIGLRDVPSVTYQEAVRIYEECSGVPIAEFTFYYTFGLFRLAVVMQQIYYRYYHGQTQDSRFAGLTPMVEALLDQAARVQQTGEW